MTVVPDAEAVAEYLGDGYTAEQVEPALAAEKADQAARCRVDPYNDALAQALCRRVARNLAMKALPLGVMSDGDLGSTRIGSTDPEVRRLEAPHRRLVIG